MRNPLVASVATQADIARRMVKSFAVVVQTHKVTPSLTARLQLARSQLSRGGVALYITLLVGDGPTHRVDRPTTSTRCVSGSTTRVANSGSR